MIVVPWPAINCFKPHAWHERSVNVPDALISDPLEFFPHSTGSPCRIFQKKHIEHQRLLQFNYVVALGLVVNPTSGQVQYSGLPAYSELTTVGINHVKLVV